MERNRFVQHFWSSHGEASAAESEEESSDDDESQIFEHCESSCHSAQDIKNDEGSSSSFLDKSSTDQRSSYNSENSCRTDESIVKNGFRVIPAKLGFDDRGGLVVT